MSVVVNMNVLTISFCQQEGISRTNCLHCIPRQDKLNPEEYLRDGDRVLYPYW